MERKGRRMILSNYIKLRKMRILVKFKDEMMKNGQMRKVGDELEIDATQAILLAKKGNVEIPDYEIKSVKQEINVDTLVKKGEDND